MKLSTPWLSLIALSDQLLPGPEAVAAQLAERFPDAAPLTVTSQSAGGVTFSFGNATGNYTLVDKPIPWENLEGPCATAWYWPEAADAMRSHTAHLFLTLLDESKDPIDRATHLTQLTTAIAATTPSGGLVWGPSAQVHKPVDFAVVASSMSRDDLPLHLWVDFRVAQREEGDFSLFTTGLEPLGHREFEVHHFTGEPQALAGAVYNVAHYILDKGPVLKDGEAVGLPDTSQVNVSFEPSIVSPEQEVIRLAFE